MRTKLIMVMILRYKHFKSKNRSAGLHPLDGFRDSLRPMMLTPQFEKFAFGGGSGKGELLVNVWFPYKCVGRQQRKKATDSGKHHRRNLRTVKCQLSVGERTPAFNTVASVRVKSQMFLVRNLTCGFLSSL